MPRHRRKAETERKENIARTARVKKTGNGTSYYYLMSRANDRRFLSLARNESTKVALATIRDDIEDVDAVARRIRRGRRGGNVLITIILKQDY